MDLCIRCDSFYKVYKKEVCAIAIRVRFISYVIKIIGTI